MCDLSIPKVFVFPTNPYTLLGLVEVTVLSSNASLTATGTVDTGSGIMTVSYSFTVGTTYLQNMYQGTYTLTLTDSGGCSLPLDFVVGPPLVPGCTNPLAVNFDGDATVDDGSCVLPVVHVYGCRNPRARNYNPSATAEDGSCEFGPEEPVNYAYDDVTSVGLIYNEQEEKWVTEQTNRPQMYMSLDSYQALALPLPGQSNDRPGASYLWEHNAGPEVFLSPTANPQPGILLYGKRHPIWFEVIVVANGVELIKNLDNLVLVSNESLPSSLVVTTPEQGTFTQQLVGGNDHLSTVTREEQLTYVQLYAPEEAPWGNRIRAQYVRLRLYFSGRRQVRISKLFAILRESLT